MRIPFVVLIIGSAALGVPGTGRAQEEGDVDRPRPLLEAWPGLQSARMGLPAFVRDTGFTVRLRTAFIEGRTVTGVERQELAQGGWLAYRSGWLLGSLQIAATLYGGAPVYAPDGKNAVLLVPGEQAYSVLGEAFAAVRYREYALLKAYRQEVVQPFINRADNKMTPNTFEGVTLGGRVSAVEYFAGYLTRIKTRNADEFVPMSVAAGAPKSNDGVALLGVKLRPLPGLSVEVGEQYGVNTFNTLFGQVEKSWPLGQGVRLQLGTLLAEQRAAGRALVATTQVTRWVTRHGAARVVLAYQDFALKGAASVTAAGNRVQGPWGFYPGYFLLIQQFFYNANEKALLVGAAYDFSKTILPGLGAFTNLAWGAGSINPVKRLPLGEEWEYDLTLEYKPPPIQGLLFRLRGAINDQAGVTGVGYLIRFNVNWELALL